MLNYDDDKKVIEMEVVSPPYILDFGGAYLDTTPAHVITACNLGQYEQDKREQFGGNWPEVKAILAEFAGLHQIHIVDVNPGNIRFSTTD